MKTDAYQMVTDRICAALEKGVKPWAVPWAGGIPSGAWSGQNGKVYSLLNQMLLSDPRKEYKTITEIMDDVRGEWVTFNQAKDRGGSIKKGEHGRPVVFYDLIEKRGQDELPEDERVKIPFIRWSTVFRLGQCEGISQKYHTETEERQNEKSLDAEQVITDYLKRTGVRLCVKNTNRAYYQPALDAVVVPEIGQYRNAAEYYSTLFHELTHSTGHASRLNRDQSGGFGSEQYSEEELVAEIGSASILATLGIEQAASFNNSAAYIKGWLKALRNDKRMIVKAAAKAEKAIRLILNIPDDKKGAA